MVVLHAVKVEKMTLIEQNTHKAIEKLFWETTPLVFAVARQSLLCLNIYKKKK